MKDLVVIIVNWNGKKHLERCLSSLNTQSYGNFETILVDNGSDDGSMEFVRNNFPDVILVELDDNKGFAYPNNVGIAKAFKNKGVRYVVTLNNDTELDRDYLEEMVACAKRNPGIGSIQPKVVNFFDGTVDSAGMLIFPDMSARDRGYGEKDNGQYDSEEEIFGASASAALYTREALEKTRLAEGEYFDNDYFAYSEDVDLAWRLRLLGFSSIYAPKAKVLHVHSATGKKHSSFKAYHLQRNQYFNIIKILPIPFLWLALLRMPWRYVMLVSSVLKKKGPSAELQRSADKGENVVVTVLRAWKDVVLSLPSLVTKRKIIQRNKTISNGEIKRWFAAYKADIKKIIYGN